jgi:SseB protein C-terminal domain
MFSWLARRSENAEVQSPAVREAQDIAFIGEQDGPVEQQLKEQLARLFDRHAGVVQAYLARATIDGQGTVVLAVHAEGIDESDLAHQAGIVFAAIFNARAHLDVLFLDAARQAQVSRVCRAFYERSG